MTLRYPEGVVVALGYPSVDIFVMKINHGLFTPHLPTDYLVFFTCPT